MGRLESVDKQLRLHRINQPSGFREIDVGARVFGDLAVQPDEEFSEVSDLLTHVGPGGDLAVYRGDRLVSGIAVFRLLFAGVSSEGFLFHEIISIVEIAAESKSAPVTGAGAQTCRQPWPSRLGAD